MDVAVHQAARRQAELAVRFQQIDERLLNLDTDVLQARMNIDVLERRADAAFRFQTNASAEMELLQDEIVRLQSTVWHYHAAAARR